MARWCAIQVWEHHTVLTRTLDPGGNITIKWDVMHWNDDVMHCLKLRPIQFSLFEAKTNFLGISLDVGRGEENLPGGLLECCVWRGGPGLGAVRRTCLECCLRRGGPSWARRGPDTCCVRRRRRARWVRAGGDQSGTAATKLGAWTRGQARRGPGTCWGPATVTSQVGAGRRRPSWAPGRGAGRGEDLERAGGWRRRRARWVRAGATKLASWTWGRSAWRWPRAPGRRGRRELLQEEWKTSSNSNLRAEWSIF